MPLGGRRTREASGARIGMLRRAAAVGLVLGAMGLATLASGRGDTNSFPRRATYPDAYPDGPGRAIAERACLICHSAMLVTQQAKDSTGWEKSLATMEKWGAPLTPAEHDTLRGYLLSHFGPRAPAK